MYGETKVFLFINYSRTCKSAPDRGESNQEDQHGERGITGTSFTKIK